MLKPKKSLKDAKKEIEDRTFGQKNKNRSSAIRKQLQKLELSVKANQGKARVSPSCAGKLVTPKNRSSEGVDRELVDDLGGKNYSNNVEKSAENLFVYGQDVKNVGEAMRLGPCKHIIEAIKLGTYSKLWTCPKSGCKGVHDADKILSGQYDDEISLEARLELLRKLLVGKLTPITEEVFDRWKREWVSARNSRRSKDAVSPMGKKGKEMFIDSPEIFTDDNEAVDINYSQRSDDPQY